ncbi:MAG: pyrroline-5-carboxylate reductase [Planctomycetaceae bacterium]|jgi:pyrroline-5-carboxylate reductase|nr:pyrroline-5-carboxylate reductase [Planctomycetaceae bacterium]MBT4725972.1 pyrroline-5-carboxylate reductase [Planctomycetaceae bacterium]MBT4846867.1 pyrroline-5-carboxylate reductase [Planctomycetaceae bacterium]MBT5124476.1 pyrroline-5-carboxylate reductase [Planctomycetaceae bacterium]MBT5597482.1 pyrroline-5-carboxylate reductase [Planctomycetaceae bacterium]
MKIGFIGAGQMATALARGFVASQEKDDGPAISFFDPSPEACAQFSKSISTATLLADAPEVVTTADIVFLAVKPQILPAVLDSIATVVTTDVLLVSIAAGVRLDVICGRTRSDRVIRVMPNTPCLISKAATAFSPARGATATDCAAVQNLLDSVGIAYQLSENCLDAVTGLSGSGPAYIYTVVQALCAGGVAMGLSEDVALQLAAQTAKGAAEMILQTGLPPQQLIDQVTSPGGTTLAGLKVMHDEDISATLIRTVRAATNRSIELGKS